MPHDTADSSYVFGAASAEHDRLIRQAAIWDPFTERLFRDGGIGPGQRVLDIGSGVGDVALLAARLVGPPERWWESSETRTRLRQPDPAS
jgi:ubiquinone/menaquinone biosynthesis C-methylase UbiE